MADVQMIPITGSSQIGAVGYNPETKEMHVNFLYGGKTYIYSDVPEHVYSAVANAPSVGSAFHSLIKQGGYGYRQV